MSLDADCIFCKIIQGELPSFKIYEDDRTYAFMDINPANPGHALVIPKFHAANIFEVPDDWLSATIVTAKKVAGAAERALSPDGVNILQANGAGAGQTVFHIHFHVLPRFTGDKLALNWGSRPGDMDDIAEVAERIKSELA